MRGPFWSVLLLSVIAGNVECARAAPPQALNKTVTVRWSSFLPANCANGTTNQVAREVTLQIYISTQGRLFSKLAARAGNSS